MRGPARTGGLAPIGVVALALFLGAAPTMAQSGGWTHWGGNPESQRYAPHDQITAENFEDLEVAWIWRGDNFGPSVDNILRLTPIYAEGKLFGVAGQRRTVIAMDPATGDTLWTFREPPTKRWADSMRKNYGKGVFLLPPGLIVPALRPLSLRSAATRPTSSPRRYAPSASAPPGPRGPAGPLPPGRPR